MTSIRNMIRYTKEVYKTRWDFPLETVVVKDSEFETLCSNPYCFVEGVRVIPESAMMEDAFDADIEVDLGNWAAVIRS